MGFDLSDTHDMIPIDLRMAHTREMQLGNENNVARPFGSDFPILRI